MKVVCHREGLLAACQIASVATASRDIKPVLKNLKAIVMEDRCILMATDLELGIRLEVRGVTVQEPGEALLPTTRLISILRESADEEMTVEAGPDRCVILGQGNEFEMPGGDPSSFPDIPSFAEEKYHEIAGGVLREMIHRTVFAAATAENSRYGATTGVLWELEGDQATLVATDGRRLAKAQGKAQAHGGHSTSGQMPVVPAKAMSLLERSISDPDEVIRISIRPNEILMKTEKAMVYSRLVEGRFPNYRQALPQKLPIKVPMTVGPFQQAVRQAAIMTDDESKRVIFGFDKKKLTLRAQGTESGRSRVELPLDYDGKAVEIGFDPKFVLDVLRVLAPDASLSIELNDSATPSIFRYDPDYLYVLVPLSSAAPRHDLLVV